MASITAMCWNIENLGEKKYSKQTSPKTASLAASIALIKLIAQVIKKNDASIVGLLEIRSNNGVDIVQDLGKELDNLMSPPTPLRWQGQASPQMGARKEQYIFLWDTQNITTYSPPHRKTLTTPTPPTSPPLPKFQFRFESPMYDAFNFVKSYYQTTQSQPERWAKTAEGDYTRFLDRPLSHEATRREITNNLLKLHPSTRIQPNPDPKWVGFTRQITSDHPPYLGYFETVPTGTGKKVKIPLALYHNRGPGQAEQLSFNCLRLVREFEDEGDACFIMGDFNLATTSSSNARYQKLLEHKFSSFLDGHLSTLISKDKAVPGMGQGSYMANAYDNAFMRDNTQNIDTASTSAIDDLIIDCLGNSYLGTPLSALENAKVPSSTPRGTYTNYYEAFPVFREHVSDHMPACIEITF